MFCFKVTLTAWKKQQESTEEDLRCTKQICDAKDKMAAELGNTMRQFVDSNKGRLRNAATLVWRQAVHAHLLNKDVRKSQLQVGPNMMVTVAKSVCSFYQYCIIIMHDSVLATYKM